MPKSIMICGTTGKGLEASNTVKNWRVRGSQGATLTLRKVCELFLEERLKNSV